MCQGDSCQNADLSPVVAVYTDTINQMLVPKFSYYAEIQQQFVAFLLVRSLIMQPPHFLYLAETRTSSRKHQKPSNDRGRDSHNR